jgi:predicted dehydrogenase
LLGPVESVAAELDRVSQLEIDVEDFALLTLRFTSGALGAVDLNYIEPAYRRGCTIVGTESVASWDWTAGKILIRHEDEEREVDVACDVADSYKALLDDFTTAAASNGTPRTSVEEGLTALRVVDSARCSASRGQRVSVG